MTFISVHTFRNHVAIKHTESQKYPCPDCGKVLSSKTSFQNHYALIHVGKTEYRCHICGKYLSKAESLQQHLNSHNNIRLPKTKPCTVCGRMFGNNRQLRYHSYTHTGERPYKCGLCDAAFTQPHCLRTHIVKRHDGEGASDGSKKVSSTSIS